MELTEYLRQFWGFEGTVSDSKRFRHFIIVIMESLIMPVSNKETCMEFENNGLKNSIAGTLRLVGMQISGAWVINISSRSL